MERIEAKEQRLKPQAASCTSERLQPPLLDHTGLFAVHRLKSLFGAAVCDNDEEADTGRPLLAPSVTVDVDVFATTTPKPLFG